MAEPFACKFTLRPLGGLLTWNLSVLISLNTGMNALRLLLPLYGVVSKARAAHSSLKSVMNTQARLDPFSKEGTPLNALYSRIEFHDVDFAYPSRPTVKVLNKLNLTFGAGKITAVIGPSGCGKSSIVALLERFYNASSGHIRINGAGIESYNVKSLRSNVRVVQQVCPDRRCVAHSLTSDLGCSAIQ